MQCSDAVKEITHYLLHGAHAGAEAPHAALTHVAGCRACLQTLAELGALWTDSPSQLRTVAPQLTCDECQEFLPLYVDTARKLRPDFAAFDAVAHHLERCSNCHEEYALLAELANAEWLYAARSTWRHAPPGPYL
ncbi:MAG: hypothetical protein IPK16_14480 [Anaerolineales bacterium]|nr:hypothetical protein [Anaerolineales bacterium]